MENVGTAGAPATKLGDIDRAIDNIRGQVETVNARLSGTLVRLRGDNPPPIAVAPKEGGKIREPIRDPEGIITTILYKENETLNSLVSTFSQLNELDEYI